MEERFLNYSHLKIYAISGLGADRTVFDYLSLKYPIHPIDWLDPHKNESIESYASRMLTFVDDSEEFILMGVSFGGLIATEMAKQIEPKKLILISSVESTKELRSIFKRIGKLGLIKLIPPFMIKPPKTVLHFLFKAQNKKALDYILEKTDVKFTKWVMQKICTWKNLQYFDQTILIQGTNDPLMPVSKNRNPIIVDNGGHFMIVDKAKTISKIINENI